MERLGVEILFNGRMSIRGHLRMASTRAASEPQAAPAAALRSFPTRSPTASSPWHERTICSLKITGRPRRCGRSL
jgi:hypothetical protein